MFVLMDYSGRELWHLCKAVTFDNAVNAIVIMDFLTEKGDSWQLLSKDNRLYLICGGSDDRRDWLRNFLYLPVTKDGLSLGLQSTVDIIVNKLLEFIKESPLDIIELICSGHSRGGALVVGVAKRLADKLNDLNKNVNMNVVTFGADKSGGREFVTAYNAHNIPTVMYKLTHDIVPHVPLSFKHVNAIVLTKKIKRIKGQFIHMSYGEWFV